RRGRSPGGGLRVALAQPRLECAAEILAGDAEEEPGAARLELDEAHVVVALAVAPGVRLRLAERAQPHRKARYSVCAGLVKRRHTFPTHFPCESSRKLRRAAADSVCAVKLLVLGGTKFLGRATVDAALARGHEVTL